MSEINSKLFRDDPAAYYTELGAEAERERIIEILKEYLVDYHYSGTKDIPELIALIKGEQK